MLIGAPGAGKTRLGKRVARILGLPFIDTDRKIVAAHGPIAEIFSVHGEAYFRRLERLAVESALSEPAVVSLGGGAILDADTRADLDSLRVALITVTAEAVQERLGSKRPLLAGAGIEAWTALVADRDPIYRTLAKGTWDTSEVPIDAVATAIAEWTAAGDPRLGEAPNEVRAS